MAKPFVQMRLLGGDAVSAAFLRMAEAIPGATTDAAFAGAQFAATRARAEGFRTRGIATGEKTTKRGTTIKTYAAFGAAIAGKLTSRTGALRGSIHAEKAGVGRAVYGATPEYAAIHEFGGEIRHSAMSRLASTRMVGKRKQSVRRHERKAYTITMPARPYLRPALADHIGEVRAVMLKSIEKSLVAAKGYTTLGEAAK